MQDEYRAGLMDIWSIGLVLLCDTIILITRYHPPPDTGHRRGISLHTVRSSRKWRVEAARATGQPSSGSRLDIPPRSRRSPCSAFHRARECSDMLVLQKTGRLRRAADDNIPPHPCPSPPLRGRGVGVRGTPSVAGRLTPLCSPLCINPATTSLRCSSNCAGARTQLAPRSQARPASM